MVYLCKIGTSVSKNLIIFALFLQIPKTYNLMKKLTVLFFLAMICMATSAQQTITVSVCNPMNQDRTDQPVVIPLADYGDIQSALVTNNGKEIPCQLDDLDLNDTYDELCFLADLGPKETREYIVTLSVDGQPRQYPARVYAEMVMRNDKVKEKNRQNNYIESITARGDCANSYNLQHHHGVEFESELNGIRIYFDKRQTLDLYGKFQKRLELQQTQFYTSDDQKREGYGDDVLWVGQTFGLGAFRGWDGQQPTMIDPVRNRTQRVVSYGPLRTIVELIDRGWVADSMKPPLNLTLCYIQYAGHRDTEVNVHFNRNVADRLFSTGIINVKGSQEFSDHKGLRACWGTDYPSTDTVKWKRETVGLAICISQDNIASEEPANNDNYAYVVRIPNKSMKYHVSYCSDNEQFGYHSEKDWFNYVNAWKRELDNPVVVKVK